MMLEPKEIEVDGKKFIISKFPSLAGYEIATQLTLSAIPKLSEFKEHKNMLIKMLGYVGVELPGMNSPLMLSTDALIDNHTGNWETMAKLAYSIYEYNVSFLERGSLSSFLNGVIEKLPDFVSKILMKWPELSSPVEKPATTSSKRR